MKYLPELLREQVRTTADQNTQASMGRVTKVKPLAAVPSEAKACELTLSQASQHHPVMTTYANIDCVLHRVFRAYDRKCPSLVTRRQSL